MYVQAYGGSDTVGTGEKNSPVASLDKALDIVASKKAEGYTDVANIIMGEGCYEVSQTISIEKTDVPTGGLNIAAAYGEAPVLSGGISYNISQATKVDDSEILDRLHNENAKSNLYELDLTTKIPLSDIPSVSYPGAYNLNSMLSSVGLENPPEATCEAIFDGNLMTVARYPNNDYAYVGEVVDGGIEGRFTDSSFDGTENDLELTQENLLKGFEFKSDYENLSRWATADQALIFGYFKNDWATQTVPLKEVNVENGTIRSEYPSYYGINTGKRYYVYNLLEEIDMPGEYFIDRTNGKMYFYMPDNAGNESTITLSMLTESMLHLRYLSDVTVSGLTFEASLGSGVQVSGCRNAIVENCEFRNMASTVINIYAKNCIARNNYIHDTNGGIVVGSESPDDEKYLLRGNNIVTNNHITRFSRLDKVYVEGIFLINGVGNIVTHNKIHDGEHLAMTFHGQYHEISYNEIYDVLQECDDAGAIYVGKTWIDRGNKITNNYIHDIDSAIESNDSVAGIFLDDHYAGAYIEGNVFANIAGHGVRGNQGREHYIANNLFVGCTQGGVYMKDASGKEEDYTTQKQKLDASYYQTSVWQTAFPALYNIMNNSPYHSVDHIYTRNVTVNCATDVNGYTPSLNAGALVDVGGSYYGKFSYENADTENGAEGISNNKKLESTDAGYASILGGNYAVNADMVGITGFKTIDFSNMIK